jgi:endonuclease/exonuclease/phosphatase family metal-dependent hydrolase
VSIEAGYGIALRGIEVALGRKLTRRKGRFGLAEAISRVPSKRRVNSVAIDQSLPQLSVTPLEGHIEEPILAQELTVATYNVHRWTGVNGRTAPDPARAGFVISELDADIIALQEVLKPYGQEDPLAALCKALGYHLAFAATRIHKRGEQGNAILSRYPFRSCSVVDISHSRIEKRGVLAAQCSSEDRTISVIATHLSVVDRTRARQATALLNHPELNAGPAVLLGDMNAWRKCKATRRMDSELSRHHNLDWPASFPARRPVFALDRVYASNVKLLELNSHNTPSSRRASDHLPVLARLRLPN